MDNRDQQALDESARNLAASNAQLAERTRDLEARNRQFQARTLELEQANQRLDSFSYSVSHDLRAPLRAISGFAHILHRRHRSDLNEEGQHFLDNIVQASVHMGRLIDDLLSFSRLGRSAIALTRVPLAEVLAEVCVNFSQRMAEKGASLETAGDLPDVLGDRTLLMQVFGNLIDNALTYQHASAVPLIHVSCSDAGGFIVVAVRDNGIGITEEHFERVFQVFQRLHSPDTYPGTGIGLAVVQRAVELQGGSVALKSVPGQGSTFYVHLPKPDAAAARCANATRDAASGLVDLER